MRRIFLAPLLFILGFAASGAARAAQGDNADNPIIIITTAEQLDAMRNGLDKHYKLAADIDLTEFLTDPKGWIPVGGSAPGGRATRDESARFTGSLDGDGHAIIGLWIPRQRLCRPVRVRAGRDHEESVHRNSGQGYYRRRVCRRACGICGERHHCELPRRRHCDGR